MDTKQIVVRPTSDPDVREYHVSEQICDLPYYEFYHPLPESSRVFSGLGSVGEKIATTLMSTGQIEAIERITFRPFSVRVRRAPTANWSTVQQATVIPALAKGLEASEEDLDVQNFSEAKLRQMALA